MVWPTITLIATSTILIKSSTSAVEMPRNSCRQAVLLFSLITTVLAGSSVYEEQLLTSENLSRLSEIRFLTVGQPDRIKCVLYRTTVKAIFSSEEHEADLFGRVIDFLKQKKLPFNNTYVVIDEMQKCLESLEVAKLGEQSTRAQLIDDSENEANIDPKMAAKVAGLESELKRTKKVAAESDAQVQQLKDQLKELRAQLDELIHSPEGSDKHCEAEKLKLASELQREIDLLRKVAGQAGDKVELERDGEMCEMHSTHDSQVEISDEQLEAVQRREKTLSGTGEGNEKPQRAVVIDDTPLNAREEQAVELYKNLSNGPGHCIKFHLLMRQEHALTIKDVAAIAQLDFVGMNTLIYNMDREFKYRLRNIYDSLKSRGSKLYSDVADELYDCAGLNRCNEGTRIKNWNMKFVFHERNLNNKV